MTANRRVLEDAIVRFENQFHNEAGLPSGGPILWFLACAREEAIESLALLINKDPSDIEGVRQLQNDVKRYFDLITWTSKTVHQADQIYKMMQYDEIDSMKREILTRTGDTSLADDD